MSLLRSDEIFDKKSIPVRVDSVMCRTKIQARMHRHEYFEILFVQNGDLINRLVDVDLVMKAGDLVIMKPYVQHVLSTSKQIPPLQAYCCSFTPQVVDSTIKSLGEASLSHLSNQYFFKPFFPLLAENVSVIQLNIDLPYRRQLCAQLQVLQELSEKNSVDCVAQLRVRFLAFLAFLADISNSTKSEALKTKIDSSNMVIRNHEKIQSTLNYIHDHAAEDLDLGEMAAMCGTSLTYFCHLFKKETGMTFVKYLNALRAQNACELLERTAKSVTEICYEVGFTDYSYFSRCFKSHSGFSAAEYRKRHAFIANQESQN